MSKKKLMDIVASRYGLEDERTIWFFSLAEKVTLSELIMALELLDMTA